MADERALDMMQAARPDVRREVLADFLAGRIARTPYLHVDPDEFRRMAAWGGNATTRTLELVAEWLEAHAHQGALGRRLIAEDAVMDAARRIRNGEPLRWVEEMGRG